MSGQHFLWHAQFSGYIAAENNHQQKQIALFS
jgi:uncharacterized membrane protein